MTNLDSMVVVEKATVTATQQLVGFGPSENDTENAAAAAAHGVLRASFINYDKALDAYAARDDIEDLAHKNKRDNPQDFADGSFMRTTTGAAGSGSSA